MQFLSLTAARLIFASIRADGIPMAVSELGKSSDETEMSNICSKLAQKERCPLRKRSCHLGPPIRLPRESKIRFELHNNMAPIPARATPTTSPPKVGRAAIPGAGAIDPEADADAEADGGADPPAKVGSLDGVTLTLTLAKHCSRDRLLLQHPPVTQYWPRGQ